MHGENTKVTVSVSVVKHICLGRTWLQYIGKFRSRIHFYMSRDITEIITPQPRFELHASCVYVTNSPARNTKCGFDGKPGNCDGDRAAVENRLEIKLKPTAEYMGCNRQFTRGHSNKTSVLRDQK